MSTPCALFDLDGTLTDSEEGLLKCMKVGLEAVGTAVPNADVLRSCIGPPLQEAFVALGVPTEQIDAAVAAYRARYSTVGLFEKKVIDGIPAVLKELADDGWDLAVATSKPAVFAERILEHFDIRDPFRFVAGATLDGSRRHKADVIEHALDSLGPEASNTVMIGDRSEDVLGAAAHGIPCIAVAWGFGSADEQRSARAASIVQTPTELLAVLRQFQASLR